MEYIVIDTESCTGKPDDGSLCSLGYATCDEQLNIIAREDIIFNPLPRRFFVGDKKHSEKTGITFAYSMEEFRNAERFSLKYQKIKSLFSGRIVLGFALANDIRYLNDACEKFNLPLLEYKFLDIQYLYKLLHPDATSIGLKTLCEIYGNEYLAHRSDEDAIASLNLLKSFLSAANLTLQELIDKYGVQFGENAKDGYYFNYSYAAINKEFGLTLSAKAKNAVFSDFLEKLPIVKRRKKVALSHKIIRLDLDELRTIIELIYENGYAFSKDKKSADILVKAEGETPLDSNNKRVRQITLKDFKEEFGFTGIKKYDDAEILIEYYTKKHR